MNSGIAPEHRRQFTPTKFIATDILLVDIPQASI
jgi:hypothetical protein